MPRTDSTSPAIDDRTAAAPVGVHLDLHTNAVAATWRGHAVIVEARLIPRYLWTTGDITVAVDGSVVLHTGGQRKVVGDARATFVLDGARHDVALSWGRGSAAVGFPVHVTIDGDVVLLDAQVVLQNPFMSFLPAAVAVGLAALFPLFLYWLAR